MAANRKFKKAQSFVLKEDSNSDDEGHDPPSSTIDIIYGSTDDEDDSPSYYQDVQEKVFEFGMSGECSETH